MLLSAGILLAIVTIIILLFANFRFLLYPLHSSLNPLTHAEKIELRGNVLFLSDLHLRVRTPFAFTENLRACVLRERVTNLIIDGDLFDSPFDAQQILRTDGGLDFLGLGGMPLENYWVLGSPPHDPRNPDTELNVVSKCAVFSCNGLVVVAYHGHDLSMKGGIAHAIDKFISPLLVEKLWRRFAGVDAHAWVIFGHTHIPGVDKKALVANCGAWASYRLVRPTATGVLLKSDSGMLRLVNIANLDVSTNQRVSSKPD